MVPAGALTLLLVCAFTCHGKAPLRCQKGEFWCRRSRTCYPEHLVCDGEYDCGDGSDRDSCGPSDGCLPGVKLCDGQTDCRDGRNESPELCGSVRPRAKAAQVCAASEFQCGNGQCIQQAWRCDHSADCSDGSDEDDCDQDECRVNNGGCSHHCEDQLMGFLCHCPDNMRLVGDSQCEDVDVCLEADVCDQLCVHLNGNLSCDCADGYNMDPTTAECKAQGDEAQLVFTSAKGLRRTSLTGTETKSLGPRLSGPGPVAALVSNRTLYWARQGRGSIHRVSLDRTSQAVTLVLKVNGSVSSLAVDWIHQLLYWTSAETGSVGVGRLDGSAQRQLITGLDEPSAVTVEPVQGVLFWAQSGSFPKIERAGVDGRDRRTLVTSAVRRPVALALDLPRQLLYWADRGTRSISRVNLEGRERKTVVESNGYLDRPLGLAIFEGFVYWTEGVTGSVCRANKHNGNQLRVLTTDVPSPGGVVILQPVLQPNAPSVCGRPGTVCRHRCEVDLLPPSPRFSCVFPETPSNTSEEPSEPTAAEIIGLIVIFSVLLLVLIVCWWRDLSGSSRRLIVQSFYLRESRDALIIQGPQMGPDSGAIKETLLKLDLDGE